MNIQDIFPEIRNPNTVDALCSIGRQIAYRMDQIAALLGEESPTQRISRERIVQPGDGARVDLSELIYLMRLLQASYPRDHAAIPVTATRTFLIENKSQEESAPVIITNNDHAKLLYYGNATCGVGSSPVIQPEQSLPLKLPPSRTLYGVVDSGTIQVSVSTLELP